MEQEMDTAKPIISTWTLRRLVKLIDCYYLVTRRMQYFATLPAMQLSLTRARSLENPST